MATQSVEMSVKGRSNELQSAAIVENSALLPDDTNVNSAEFVDKSEDILSFTNKLIINLTQKECTNEIFKTNGVNAVYEVLNQAGEIVFTIGQCPNNENVQSFVIANSAGYGIMTLTNKGLLNAVCDVDGAGLLNFTQVRHFHGGYTLRDPYKDLVIIRAGWIPFSICCFKAFSSAVMDISDLDGTNTGSILFETRNSVHDARTLSLNFIPNLNPKAKYMLFAASIRVMFDYFG